MYLYTLLVVKIESKTLATAIKEPQGIIDKACEVELNQEGYEWTRMFYVANSLVCDMILSTPAILNIQATISVGTAPVAIQPAGMDRFSLRMRRGNCITEERSELSTAGNSSLARPNPLPVWGADVENQINSGSEFASLDP